MKPRNYNSKFVYSIDSSELAGILGVNKRTVERMAKDGVCVRLEHGRYDLVSSLTNFVAKTKEESKNRAPGEEHARLIKEKADKLEMENAKTRNELVEVAHVEQVIMEIQAIYNQQLDALGPRLAGQIANESDPAIVLDLIQDETRRTRQNTSGEYDRRFGLSQENEAVE